MTKEGIRPFVEFYKGEKLRIPPQDEILSLFSIAMKLHKQVENIELFDSAPSLGRAPEN